MSQTIVNFLVDVLLLCITLGLTWSTCLLKFVFPPATRAGGWRLWGLDYDAWSSVQVSLLGVILLAILVHVMLHWKWVCSVIAIRLLRCPGKVDDGTETLYGVAVLIVMVAATTVLLVAAELMIRPPTSP
jgi:hypothetical protein